MGDSVNREARAAGLSIEDEKQVFLLHFAHPDTRCKITQACRLAEIEVGTFYQWMRNDEKFLEKVREIQLAWNEERVDLAEAMLEDNVLRGKSADIRFMLGQLGEHRGWGKRGTGKGQGQGSLGSGKPQEQLSWPEEPKSLEEWEQQVIDAEVVKTEEKPKGNKEEQ
jgi:hypothetical protein